MKIHLWIEILSSYAFPFILDRIKIHFVEVGGHQIIPRTRLNKKRWLPPAHPLDRVAIFHFCSITSLRWAGSCNRLLQIMRHLGTRLLEFRPRVRDVIKFQQKCVFNVNALALMPAFSTDNFFLTKAFRRHVWSWSIHSVTYVNFLILNCIEYFNRRFINHLHVTYYVLPAVKISSIVYHFRAIARPTCVGHSAYYIVRNRCFYAY